ncbi:GAF domain-containing sensor histidine kinase [Dethiosulfatarculus sandiegensis]|nr:GAF domain-containing sensor histidine kinase [Dethiosulfatarculus sandiegensis]
MMTDFDQFETFYRTFREVISAVHASNETTEVLDLVVLKITQVLNAKGALIRLLNLETNRFELSASYGLSERYLAKGPISSKRLISDLYKKNKVVIIKDMLNDPRVQYPKEAREEGIEMMLDVPMSMEENIIGILRTFLGRKREFSEAELHFVVSIVEQCACAIQKARLLETQKSRYDHLATQTEKLSALGRMAAGIAHEINNPLAGILLYSSNMSKKVPNDSPLKEGLEIISHEAMRCRDIIQELLEFSREREAQKKMTDVNQVMAKALAVVGNELHLNHIELEKNFASELPESMLDQNQVEQVLINLLLNAIQSINERGKITVTTRTISKGKRIQVEVTDSGKGISGEYISRVFEPFFSTKPNGTGLGLSVSYGIMKGHQGTIDIQSSLGEGTKVILEFPVTRQAENFGE